jgi:hypothetical protein
MSLLQFDITPASAVAQYAIQSARCAYMVSMVVCMPCRQGSFYLFSHPALASRFASPRLRCGQSHRHQLHAPRVVD